MKAKHIRPGDRLDGRIVIAVAHYHAPFLGNCVDLRLDDRTLSMLYFNDRLDAERGIPLTDMRTADREPPTCL